MSLLGSANILLGSHGMSALNRRIRFHEDPLLNLKAEMTFLHAPLRSEREITSEERSNSRRSRSKAGKRDRSISSSLERRERHRRQRRSRTPRVHDHHTPRRRDSRSPDLGRYYYRGHCRSRSPRPYHYLPHRYRDDYVDAYSFHYPTSSYHEEEYIPRRSHREQHKNSSSETESRSASPEVQASSLHSAVTSATLPPTPAALSSNSPFVPPTSNPSCTEQVPRQDAVPSTSGQGAAGSSGAVPEPPSPVDVSPLEVVYYPPDGALARIKGKDNTVWFEWRQAYHGDFPLVTSNPISFKLGYEPLREAFPDFISDCYTDPSSRPNFTRASEDLTVGQYIFDQEVKDALGFTVSLTPPGTHMHKQHPLDGEVRKALNKHRNNYTVEANLRKLLKDIEPQEPHKKLAAHPDRPLLSKVASFMTVTAAEGADEVISFLNLGTSASRSYVSVIPFSDLYVAVPTIKSLAVQHHLKQKHLFQLDFYNHVAATPSFISNIKSSLSGSASDQSTRWKFTIC